MWWSFSCAAAAEAEWLRPAYMAYLRARGHADDDYYAAELIFGELIGNVVRHAPGPIRIDVTWAEDAQPLLVVTDSGAGFVLPEILPENILSESGRGLFLVNVFGEGLAVRANPNGTHSVSVSLRMRRARSCAEEVVGAMRRTAKRHDEARSTALVHARAHPT